MNASIRVFVASYSEIVVSMELVTVFKETLLVSFFVFVMMLLVDFIDSASKRRMSTTI